MLRKRKILFLLQDFAHGGIPKVLLNLLNNWYPESWDISLFVGNHNGIFKKQVPLHCKLLSEYWILRYLQCNWRKETGFPLLFAILLKILRHILRVVLRVDILNWGNWRCGRKLSMGDYDVIWCCSEGQPAQWAKYIRAKSKFLWIHNDYSWCGKGIIRENVPDYSFFHGFVCVSNYTADSFIDFMRLEMGFDISMRVHTLYNMVNVQEILEKSSEAIDDSLFEYDCFTIVSVGRICWQKNFDIIPKIACKLKQKRLAFRWYIIGGGSKIETNRLSNAILANGVQEDVVLLGVKENPYKYMAKADLFVITSRYESYPTVVNESKILNIPLLCNNYNGVDEILNTNYGMVLPIDDFPEFIYEFASGKRKMQNSIFDWERHNRDVLTHFLKIINHCPRKIAFIAPGGLPVPSIEGGAVEYLMDVVINALEKQENLLLFVFSGSFNLREDKIFIGGNCTFIQKRMRKACCVYLYKILYHFYPLLKYKSYLKAIEKRLNTEIVDTIVIENQPQFVKYLKKNLGSRTILHLHNESPYLLTRLCDTLPNDTSLILTVSHYIKKKVKDKFPVANVLTLHNGVDTALFAPCENEGKRLSIRRQYNIPDKSFVFGFVGRITPEKGLDVLFESYRNLNDLNDICLVVIGSSWFGRSSNSQYQKGLEKIASTCVNPIIFTGYLEHNTVADVESTFDAMVLPSMWDDPFPLSVLEAMSSGLPVISTRSGGIPEVLNDSCGFLLERDRSVVDKLSLCMRNCVLNKKTMIKMGINARKHIKTNFTTQAFVYAFKMAVIPEK